MRFRRDKEQIKENLGIKSIAIITFGAFAIVLPIIYVAIYYFLNTLGLKSLLYQKASFYCSTLGNITCFLGATILVTVTIISIFIRLNPMSHSKKYIEILKRQKYWGISIISIYIFFAILNSAFCSIIQSTNNTNPVIKDDLLLAKIGFLGTMELLYLILLFLIFWLLLELTSTDNIVSKAVDSYFQKKQDDGTISETAFLKKENYEPIFNIINSSLNDLDVGGAQQGFTKIKDATTYEVNNYKINDNANFETIMKNFISSCIEYNKNLFRSCIFSIAKGEQTFALGLIQPINDFSNRLFFKILESGDSLRQNTINQFQSGNQEINNGEQKPDLNKNCQMHITDESKKDDKYQLPDKYYQHSRELHQEFKANRKNNELYLKFKSGNDDSIEFIDEIINELIIKPIDSEILSKKKSSGDFDNYFDSVLPNLSITRELKTIGEAAISKYYQDIALSALNEISYSCNFYSRFNSLSNTRWTEHHIWFIKDLAVCAIDQNQEYISIVAIKKITKIAHNIIFCSYLSEEKFKTDITVKSSGAIKEIALVAIDNKFERCTNTAIKSLTEIAKDFHKAFPKAHSSEFNTTSPEVLIIWHLKNIGKFAVANGLEKSVVRTCQALSDIFINIINNCNTPINDNSENEIPINDLVKIIIEANCELAEISKGHSLSEAASKLIINYIDILKYLKKRNKYDSSYGRKLIESFKQNIIIKDYKERPILKKLLISIYYSEKVNKENENDYKKTNDETIFDEIIDSLLKIKEKTDRDNT